MAVAPTDVRLTEQPLVPQGAVAEESVAGLEYRRFGPFHRWAHFFVMASFTILVFTGMPLKYKDAGWAGTLMGFFGGVQAAGVYHRIAALILVACVVCELLYFARYIVGRRGPLWGPGTIVPTRRDWSDMKAMYRWFFGLGPKPLGFDRYTYWEKFEFWAASGGVMTMVATGFILWFPVQVARFLPGIFLNLAMVNHAGGALLAMGFVFVFWHVFHAHFRPEVFPFDKAMFDGTLPATEYAEERTLEYQRRVRTGTLSEVLIEPAGPNRKALENIVWWAITLVAMVVWTIFAVFTAWITLLWIGVI
ncbi:MAG TPA: cytochrome b/b6 domain-containing protein [Thermoleophilia bacterium]|nr:cytochrome b/b6 domain-containing protein [Thermoleophilia bacterium]